MVLRMLFHDMFSQLVFQNCQGATTTPNKVVGAFVVVKVFLEPPAGSQNN